MTARVESAPNPKAQQQSVQAAAATTRGHQDGGFSRGCPEVPARACAVGRVCARHGAAAFKGEEMVYYFFMPTVCSTVVG